MDQWVRLLKEALKRAEIPVHMLENYVDDVNLVTSIIEPGYKWEKVLGQEVLNWSKEREREEIERGKSPQEETLEKIRELASRLVPGIHFTKDLPENNPEGRVPMLDVAVWLDKKDGYPRIRHSFYEKPLTSPLVFSQKGSLCIKAKDCHFNRRN